MRLKRVGFYWAMSISILMFLNTCSYESKRVYEQSTYGPSLEVPPDLTKPENDPSFVTPSVLEKPATFVREEKRCDCEQGEKSLLPLPDQELIKFRRDGGLRWLELKGQVADYWPWIRQFFLKNDFEFTLEDPVIGVIETEWKQMDVNLPKENGAPVGEEIAGKVYAVPVEEKFRIRLEEGEQADTLNVFLTHRGVELLSRDDLIVWKLRPYDANLEVEMLRKLLIYLGIEIEKSGGVLKDPPYRNVSISKSSGKTLILIVDGKFPEIWRRVGVILDHLNYVVIGQERDNGMYEVKHYDPLKEDNTPVSKSWLSGLFSRKSDSATKLSVSLSDEGSVTHITIQNMDGTAVEEKIAQPLLEQILEQLK